MSACWGRGGMWEWNTSELPLLPAAVFITTPFLKFIIHVSLPSVLSVVTALVSDRDFVLFDMRSSLEVSHCSRLCLPLLSCSSPMFACLVISQLAVFLFLSAFSLNCVSSFTLKTANSFNLRFWKLRTFTFLLFIHFNEATRCAAPLLLWHFPA